MSSLTAALYGALVVYLGGWFLGFWSGNFSLLLFILAIVTLSFWLAERFHFRPAREAAAIELEKQDVARRAGLAKMGIDKVDGHLGQASAARHILLFQFNGSGFTRRPEVETFRQPEAQRDDGQDEKQQGKIATPEAKKPAAQIDDQSAVQRRSE